MKKNKNKCELCGKSFEDVELGNETKIGVLCVRCYKKELKVLVPNLVKFAKSNKFEETYTLCSKICWLSDEMANWSSLALNDYLDLDEYALKGIFLNQTLDLMEELEIKKTNQDYKLISKLAKGVAKSV